MNLMRHHLQIQRVPRGRVLVLRLMAQHAQLDSNRMSAVKDQLIMAGIATGGANHVARHRNRRPIGDEVEGVPRVAGAQVEGRKIPAANHANGSGHAGIESRRSLAFNVYWYWPAAKAVSVPPPSSKVGRVMVPSNLPVACAVVYATYCS